MSKLDVRLVPKPRARRLPPITARSVLPDADTQALIDSLQSSLRAVGERAVKRRAARVGEIGFVRGSLWDGRPAVFHFLTGATPENNGSLSYVALDADMESLLPATFPDLASRAWTLVADRGGRDAGVKLLLRSDTPTAARLIFAIANGIAYDAVPRGMGATPASRNCIDLRAANIALAPQGRKAEAASPKPTEDLDAASYGVFDAYRRELRELPRNSRARRIRELGFLPVRLCGGEAVVLRFLAGKMREDGSNWAAILDEDMPARLRAALPDVDGRLWGLGQSEGRHKITLHNTARKTISLPRAVFAIRCGVPYESLPDDGDVSVVDRNALNCLSANLDLLQSVFKVRRRSS